MIAIARIAALLLLLCLAPLQAAETIVSFDNPEHSRLYQVLLKEYRCLKCQNQNLADSNASLASDLRREIREQIIAGKTRDDIDGYLVARYGEFVLYRPRFSAKTAILWIGPFLLLLVGLISVYLMIRRRSIGRGQRIVGLVDSASGKEELAARLEKARRLLKER